MELKSTNFAVLYIRPDAQRFITQSLKLRFKLIDLYRQIAKF